MPPKTIQGFAFLLGFLDFVFSSFFSYDLFWVLGLVVAVLLWVEGGGRNVTYTDDGGCISEAASTNPPNPKAYSHTHDTHLRNPTRPPLLPFKKDNGLVPKRTKSRQVSSRYMSPFPSTSASMPRHCSSLLHEFLCLINAIVAPLLTSLSGRQPPPLSLSFSYFSLLVMSKGKEREKKGKERERGGGCRPKRAVSDGR